MSLGLGLVRVVASYVQRSLQLGLIELNKRRLLVDQLLHRILLALRVEAPHVEGDQLQLLPFLSLLMFLTLLVRDFFPFFIPLLLVFFLFLFPPLLFPIIQLF